MLSAQVSWNGSAIVITDNGDGNAENITIQAKDPNTGQSFFSVIDSGKTVFDGSTSNPVCDDSDITSISVTASPKADTINLRGVSLTSGPFKLALDRHVTISGGDGNDTIFGSAFAQTIDGDNGDDSITGGVQSDTIDGGVGNDTILGYGGGDSILGGDGDDSILGDYDTVGSSGTTDGNDTIYAGQGRDTVYGSGGNDYINMGTWDSATELAELCHGGDGNDTLTEDPGNDCGSNFFGDNDNDSIVCGNGTPAVDQTGTIIPSNSAFGGAGDDTIVGGSNYDVLYGMSGNDSILGANGAHPEGASPGGLE